MTEEREVIDWSERRKYVELVAHYSGYLDEEETGDRPVTIQINWGGPPPAWARDGQRD